MELNEIRLGNKISINGKVYTIDAKMMYAFFSGNRDYDISNFNPIPLTEEWLEKLGFEQKSGREYSKGKFTYRFQQEDLIVEGYCYDYNGITCNPEYVHQLQNLYFALTGEELQLK